eukprot:gene11272-24155_t
MGTTALDAPVPVPVAAPSGRGGAPARWASLGAGFGAGGALLYGG